MKAIGDSIYLRDYVLSIYTAKTQSGLDLIYVQFRLGVIHLLCPQDFWDFALSPPCPQIHATSLMLLYYVNFMA